MKNNPQDQQPQAANLSGQVSTSLPTPCRLNCALADLFFQAHVGRESTTACMLQQQHGDLAFGQFRQAALTAIRQILDATTGNRGPLFFEAAQRFFSEAEQAMSKMKKRMRETNAPMINANDNAITQAVDIDRAREGYEEAERIAVGQGDNTQSLYQLLEDSDAASASYSTEHSSQPSKGMPSPLPNQVSRQPIELLNTLMSYILANRRL